MGLRRDLVSIIIPCFRQGRYLAEAINSCLGQTYRHIEVLVVNDGSDDDTEFIASSYGPPVTHIWRSNGGLSAARNTGIAAASGRWIKFLDADDHLDPQHLEIQLDMLASRSDCIGACTVRSYHETEPNNFVDIVPGFSAFLPDFLRQPDSAVHAFLFPSELVRAVNGFDEAVRIAEDWDFFCRVGKLRPTVISDKRVGAFYRLRAGSMSRDRTGMLLSVATQLVRLHAEFKAEPGRPWYGRDLLYAEQSTFRRLLKCNLGTHKIASDLRGCISELQCEFGVYAESWKFSALSKVLGYESAERLRVLLEKLRRTRHSPSDIVPST